MNSKSFGFENNGSRVTMGYSQEPGERKDDQGEVQGSPVSMQDFLSMLAYGDDPAVHSLVCDPTRNGVVFQYFLEAVKQSARVRVDSAMAREEECPEQKGVDKENFRKLFRVSGQADSDSKEQEAGTEGPGKDVTKADPALFHERGQMLVGQYGFLNSMLEGMPETVRMVYDEAVERGDNYIMDELGRGTRGQFMKMNVPEEGFCEAWLKVIGKVRMAQRFVKRGDANELKIDIYRILSDDCWSQPELEGLWETGSPERKFAIRMLVEQVANQVKSGRSIDEAMLHAAAVMASTPEFLDECPETGVKLANWLDQRYYEDAEELGYARNEPDFPPYYREVYGGMIDWFIGRKEGGFEERNKMDKVEYWKKYLEHRVGMMMERVLPDGVGKRIFPEDI